MILETNSNTFVASNEVKGLSYRPLYHATSNWDQLDVGFTCLTKFDPNVEYPELRLLGSVEYFIFYGEIVINDQMCKEGDYIRIETGNVKGKATDKGCTILCVYHNGAEIIKKEK